MKKRIAVTGATGFIGSSLCHALTEGGHEVIRFSRATGALLGEPLDATRLQNCSAIIHLAHSASPATISGTQTWHTQSLSAGIPVQIFLSSFSASHQSKTHYGQSKAELEDFFLAQGNSVVRPGLVIGSGGLCGRLLGLCKRLPIIPVPGGAELQVQITGLDALVQVLVAMVSSEPPMNPAKPLQVVSSAPRTLEALTKELALQARSSAKIVSIPLGASLKLLAFGGAMTRGLKQLQESFQNLNDGQSVTFAKDQVFSSTLDPRSLTQIVRDNLASAS